MVHRKNIVVSPIKRYMLTEKSYMIHRLMLEKNRLVTHEVTNAEIADSLADTPVIGEG